MPIARNGFNISPPPQLFKTFFLKLEVKTCQSTIALQKKMDIIHSCLRDPVKIVVWTYDTFDNNLGIKHCLKGVGSGLVISVNYSPNMLV